MQSIPISSINLPNDTCAASNLIPSIYRMVSPLRVSEFPIKFLGAFIVGRGTIRQPWPAMGMHAHVEAREDGSSLDNRAPSSKQLELRFGFLFCRGKREMGFEFLRRRKASSVLTCGARRHRRLTTENAEPHFLSPAPHLHPVPYPF
ncbi:hypothetical protein CRG98_016162 [Punica granatum]|uniref:Uncharacterized protein n=1 Tax=Punica granatum TaxID=22663 RepID=A0A2I0K4M8_PUNGR|nr:hypothetical protein CRG98_016162 [Punica granatum]